MVFRSINCGPSLRRPTPAVSRLAGRQLLRAQSAVSELISRLEGEVGVALFSRSGRYPTLTPQGTVLLADARAVVADVDVMRARANGMSAGIEPELSVVIDAMFPIAAIATAAGEFRDRFPATPLRLFVEALGNGFQPLIDKHASVGIVGPMPGGLPSLSIERLQAIPMVMVAAAGHPLALHAQPHSALGVGKAYPARFDRPLVVDRRKRRLRAVFDDLAGSPTCSSSAHSCSPVSGGAGCRCTRLRRS